MSASDTPVKPYIICVKTGPTYHLSDQIEHLATVLSKRFTGAFLTYGPAPSRTRIGQFDVICDLVPDTNSLLHRLRYRRQAIDCGVRLAEAARANGSDPVVLSYDPLFGGSVAATIKSRADVPMIIELNNAFGDPDNWIDIRPRWKRWLKFKRASGFAARVLHRADGIRIMHEGQLDGLRVDTSQKHVVLGFDGVPLERFAWADDQPYVLVVGFPFLRKGIDVMLKAFARLRMDFPAWRLVLIGHEIAPRAAASGLPMDGVEAMKPVPNVQIVELIAKAGIVVVPSRSEGIPRILLEAAAASKARIGAAINGVPRVIEDGEDGLLFSKGDVEGLERALRQLMQQPDLRKKFGVAARERVLREFGDEAYCQWVEDLVSGVLARRRSEKRAA